MPSVPLIQLPPFLCNPADAPYALYKGLNGTWNKLPPVDQAMKYKSGIPSSSVQGYHSIDIMQAPAVIDTTQDDNCECTLGWVLFGLGWLIPICWVVGALLPCCSSDRNDRKAAIASRIMWLIFCVILVSIYWLR
jgi:hypothetical protein